MGRLMGIEPTNDGATIRCVNHFTTIAIAFLTFYQASYIIAYSLCFVNTFIELIEIENIQKNMEGNQYGNIEDKGDNNSRKQYERL